MRFIEILEETLLGFRCQPFTDCHADVIKHPKLFFFDVGLVNGLMGNFVISPDRAGFLFDPP